MNIILFIKKKKPFSNKIISFVKIFSNEVKIVYVDNLKRIPKNINFNKFDFLISYLCPIKFKKNELIKIKQASINFHPGPPKYPGIGCFNYAIFNKDLSYGVTCHFMNEKIDNGKIIEVKKFYLTRNETIQSISYKSYSNMYKLFLKIFKKIIKGKKIYKFTKHRWSKKYYSKKDFNNFLKIKIRNPKIERYLRSTVFKNYKSPIIKVGQYELHNK